MFADSGRIPLSSLMLLFMLTGYIITQVFGMCSHSPSPSETYFGDTYPELNLNFSAVWPVLAVDQLCFTGTVSAFQISPWPALYSGIMRTWPNVGSSLLYFIFLPYSQEPQETGALQLISVVEQGPQTKTKWNLQKITSACRINHFDSVISVIHFILHSHQFHQKVFLNLTNKNFEITSLAQKYILS